MGLHLAGLGVEWEWMIPAGLVMISNERMRSNDKLSTYENKAVFLLLLQVTFQFTFSCWVLDISKSKPLEERSGTLTFVLGLD